MAAIGFSTGALSLSDFRRALDVLRQTDATAVELSALRQHEWFPLLEAIPSLPLSQFEHVSVHLPSTIDVAIEERLCASLNAIPSDWLLVTHPDILNRWELWTGLGNRLCIENMDKRKPIGQTASDLQQIFRKLPQASFCLDLGHIHQVDATMGEAVLILDQLKGRLRQLHVSEVNSQSKHDPISLQSAHAFSMIAGLIPQETPVILESRISPLSVRDVQAEIDYARSVLGQHIAATLAGD